MLRLIIVLMTLVICVNSYANTSIKLNSDRDNYIFDADIEIDTTTVVNATETHLSIETEYFTFDFQAPVSKPFGDGESYLNAGNFPFAGYNSASIKVDSKFVGCGNFRGNIYVYEYDLSGEQPKIALDFTQGCGGFSGVLAGQVRINSDVPSPFGAPFVVVEPIGDTYESGGVRLEAGNSYSEEPFSSDVLITNFEWSQVSGPEVTFSDSSVAYPWLTIGDDIALEGDVVTLRLTITDQLGRTASKDITIEIKSKSAPTTYLQLIPESYDFVTRGLPRYFDLSNSAIELNLPSDNSLYISVKENAFWSVVFAAPDEAKLNEGAYESAGDYPFQASGQPGISISGDGRACYESLGFFTIHHLEYDEMEDPVSLSATFTHFCGEENRDTVRGEVYFNAKNISVPTANAGPDITVDEGDTVTLNGNASQDSDGTLVEYLWSTDNESISIDGNGNVSATFEAPQTADEERIVVSLIVKDNLGFKAKDTLTVSVRNKPQQTNGSSTPEALSNSSSGGGSFAYLTMFGLIVVLFRKLAKTVEQQANNV